VKTSCISHPAKTPLVLVRQDLIDVCEGNLFAGIILSILEYWTNIKLAIHKQVDVENLAREKEGFPTLEKDLWIYKSGTDFMTDSLGLLKEHDVTPAVRLLQALGFIEIRTNPKYKWDRTHQYRLVVEAVQKSINGLQQKPKNAVSMPNQCEINEKPVSLQSEADAVAIPETTTETTLTENRTSSSSTGAALVFQKWQSVRGGAVNQLDCQQIGDLADEFTPEWVVAAIETANAARNDRLPSLRFIESILRRWKREGFQAPMKKKRELDTRESRTKTIIGDDAMYQQLFGATHETPDRSTKK
jgi:hypothetical protein